MHTTLELVKEGKDFEHMLANFDDTKTAVGFPDYYVQEEKYKWDK